MKDVELIVTDTETASLEGGVCDIAIAFLDANLDIIWQAESLIDPERPISPVASGIHHIVDSMVADAPTLAEFMELNDYPFNWHRPIIGGHNIKFDIRVLGEHIPEDHEKLCTLKLARVLYPDAPNHQLQTLRYMFNLDAGTAHRAMGDVITCINFMRMVCEQHGVGVGGLLSLMSQPLGPNTVMPFGEHQGKKLAEIPRGYLQWIVNKSKADDDLKAAARAVLN